MSKRVLVVLSEYGYWGEELVGPLRVLDLAGYESTFVTPTGKRAHALPPSMDADYVDPPLGRPVTTPEMARATRELNESSRLDTPLSLRDLLPEPPYYSAPDHLRRRASWAWIRR
jgi:putative intracellular protease/amidase